MKINAMLRKRMSLEEITARLNAEKVPPIHGANRWTASYVRKVFVSADHRHEPAAAPHPRYCGRRVELFALRLGEHLTASIRSRVVPRASLSQTACVAEMRGWGWSLGAAHPPAPRAELLRGSKPRSRTSPPQPPTCAAPSPPGEKQPADVLWLPPAHRDGRSRRHVPQPLTRREASTGSLTRGTSPKRPTTLTMLPAKQPSARPGSTHHFDPPNIGRTADDTASAAVSAVSWLWRQALR
jgi:hypothetical protein